MESSLKFTSYSCSLLNFYINEDGNLEIEKNNFQDIAVLDDENIKQLKDFLNQLPE